MNPDVLVAVVRIRGVVGLNGDIRNTLEMLKLHKRNFCTVHKATPSIVGMINKAKDYITWGEIDESTLKDMIDQRGEPNPKDKNKTKPFFRLNCPKKGYGRKGIKKPFNCGGGLGYRGAKINDLIRNMMH
ncbi:MAG: uL30 family ribosomal protein [Candidatus Woesearchaeota archaeon]